MADFVPVDRDEHGCLLATTPAEKEDFGFFDCRWQFEDLFHLDLVRQGFADFRTAGHGIGNQIGGR